MPSKSLPLETKIRNLISANGPINIAEFMKTCLYDPQSGYYMTSRPFGSDGDFVTAPDVSQMFGELIAAWCIEVWESMGEPTQFYLIELGPGRGTLMLDVIRVAKINPKFLQAVQIQLVEISPRLVQQQKDTLKDSPVEIQWHQEVPSLADGCFILIANEFLDALPIQQFVYEEGNWYERVVGLKDGGKLTFGLGPNVSDLNIDLASLKPNGNGDLLEIAPAAEAIICEIAQALVLRTGAALLIDYGYLKSAFGDSLQAVKGHQFIDILESPGSVDLTSHVNFEMIKTTAEAAGSSCFGPVTQAEFLLNLGLIERAGALGRGKDQSVQDDIHLAVDRLAGSDQMGDLFKVVALTSPGLNVPGFTSKSPDGQN